MKHSSLMEISVHEAVQEAKLLLRENSDKADVTLEIVEAILQGVDAKRGNAFEASNKSDLDYLNSVRRLASFLDYKDKYTKGHCERVSEYALMLGRALELSESEMINLELSAMLHDIGKLAVPDHIINKEDKLTPQEYEIIKMHPTVGYELLKDVPYLEVGRNILHHHERIDGKGYPYGIYAEQLDIISKIISVVDAYDAMTSSRPYRKDGLSKEQAISQLEQCTGSQFDVEVVSIFVRLIKSSDFA